MLFPFKLIHRSRLACRVGAFWVVTGSMVQAAPIATVTESVNKVHHGSNESVIAKPAPQGTTLQDGEYLQTGASSRAELSLPDATITRLGAETVFNFSAADNQLNVEAGTVLFSKPKEGRQLNIKTAAVTAAITGTTGFIQVKKVAGKDATTIIGLIEGHAQGLVNGIVFVLGPGDILIFNPGQPPQKVAYDVPRFVRTSPLFNSFKGTLPNQFYIDAELKAFQNLVDRGFIMPPGQGFYVYTPDQPNPLAPADVPLDSAQNQRLRDITDVSTAPAVETGSPTGGTNFPTGPGTNL